MFVLLQEGSIGSHIVIRPIPSRLLNFVSKMNHKNESDADTLNDDEMFLDQDGELSSEVAIDTGLPIKRNKNVHPHIVYKLKNNEEPDRFSDFGK